jgi:acid phosphatase family membrane protein YuiD
MGILGIIGNDVLIVSLASWLIAQLTKIVINGIVTKKFDIERLVGDGGMPSGHSATVTAMALMTGFRLGFDNPIFGIAMIFAIVVMHDATGVRQEAGKHARSIIELTEIFNEYLLEHDEEVKLEKLKTLVGHTPLQVLCGAGVGIIVVVLYLVITKDYETLISFIPTKM